MAAGSGWGWENLIRFCEKHKRGLEVVMLFRKLVKMTYDILEASKVERVKRAMGITIIAD